MIKRKPNQWMPVHIDDFMSRTEHLSTEERGAYLLLLFYYWRNQEPLPDSDKQLARIAGLSLPEWQEAATLIRPFFELKDDKLHNKRIDAEIEKAVVISGKRQAAGKRGGRPVKTKTEAKAKQLVSDKKANALQMQSKDEPTDKPNANTRACNGPRSETSTYPPVFIGLEDDEVESLIQGIESEWNNDPKISKARADARKLVLRDSVRGVA